VTMGLYDTLPVPMMGPADAIRQLRTRLPELCHLLGNPVSEKWECVTASDEKSKGRVTTAPGSWTSYVGWAMRRGDKRKRPMLPRRTLTIFGSDLASGRNVNVEIPRKESSAFSH
jgi:hypothetical protein